MGQGSIRRWLAGSPQVRVVIVCGHFEGVDERIIAARQLEEVSVGDYVLSGGEIAGLIVLDAAVRLLPGVMGTARSAHEESFEHGLLEHRITRDRGCSRAGRSRMSCCRAITRRSPGGNAWRPSGQPANAGLICGTRGQRTVNSCSVKRRG